MRRMGDFFNENDLKQLDRWLAQARGGCRESLGKALNACRRYLLAIANRELTAELKAKEGVSDLVQDTFLEAQRDFAHFEGKSRAELLAWLRQMLLHNLEDLTRKYWGADKRLLDREVSLDDDKGLHDPKRDFLDPAPSPSGLAIRKEQEQALQACLERLPKSYRQVIEWVHRDNRSYADIGSCLGISADAARKLHHRAVALLTQQLNAPP